MNQTELNLTLEQDEKAEFLASRETVKAMLPMLYTTRGNLLKPAGGKVRISGKNAASIMTGVSHVMNSDENITITTPEWTCTFAAHISKGMRDFGLVAEIMLSGYILTA